MAAEILSYRLQDGTQLQVEVRYRRNNRHIRLHMERDGSLWLSAPFYASRQDLWQSLQGAEAWIRKRLQKKDPDRNGILRYRGRECEVFLQRTEETGVQPEWDPDGEKVRIRVKAPTPAQAQTVFRQWWKEEAFRMLSREMEKWGPLLLSRGLLLPEFRVRRLRRSWGICYPERKRIHFNEMLLAVPEKAMEYVVLHETAHLIVPNHGPEFKALLTQYMPDWKKRRTLLKTEAAEMEERIPIK